MTEPNLHELNKVLAEFCGVEVEEVDTDDCPLSLWMACRYPSNRIERWTPCTDHNQMALVKAKLREKEYWHEIFWNVLNKKYVANIWKYYINFSVVKEHPDELIAFALAVKEAVKNEPT